MSEQFDVSKATIPPSRFNPGLINPPWGHGRVNDAATECVRQAAVNHYLYRIEGSGQKIEEFTSHYDRLFPDAIARDAAAHEYYEHDGWELPWPLNFELFLMDGSLLGKFEIDVEAIPAFHATPIKGE